MVSAVPHEPGRLAGLRVHPTDRRMAVDSFRAFSSGTGRRIQRRWKDGDVRVRCGLVLGLDLDPELVTEDADLCRRFDSYAHARADDVEHLDDDVVGDADPFTYLSCDDENRTTLLPRCHSPAPIGSVFRSSLRSAPAPRIEAAEQRIRWRLCRSDALAVTRCSRSPVMVKPRLSGVARTAQKISAYGRSGQSRMA